MLYSKWHPNTCMDDLNGENGYRIYGFRVMKSIAVNLVFRATTA